MEVYQGGEFDYEMEEERENQRRRRRMAVIIGSIVLAGLFWIAAVT